MKQILPHIGVGTNPAGQVTLVFGDIELFDFIEDYLTEECGIVYEFHRAIKTAGREIITMYFPAIVTEEDLKSALLRLDVGEIERIYRLNYHTE